MADRPPSEQPPGRPLRRPGYRVHVPPGYRDDTPSSVILFLHGAGERGSDNERQLQVGLPPALHAHPGRWPALVVSPQAPADTLWMGETAAAALAALETTQTEFNIDPGRILLTGLSMGGHGAWYLAYRHPERFAAIVPVCGWVSRIGLSRDATESVVPDADAEACGGDPFVALAMRLRVLPIWSFHGAEDPAVPVEESRRAALALASVGGAARYTELAGVGHAAWESAYDSTELAEWLQLRRRDV